MKIDRLRGFRDLYPEDMEPKDCFLQTAKSVARSFGYSMVDYPSIEPMELYTEKSGEELVGQTFSFTDRGGRRVTLLPEATPSVMRMITSRKDIPRPVRWFGIPKIWRYEEPQSGRLREHFQINADLFGPDSADADAEIISLASTILQRSGLEGKFEIRLNNRELMDQILKSSGVSQTGNALNLIDRFHKMEESEFIEAFSALSDSDSMVNAMVELLKAKMDVKRLAEVVAQKMPGLDMTTTIERIRRTVDIVSGYTGVLPVIDLSIVRGLSYYTGIVFEFVDSDGNFRSILGGGRYNKLSTLFSDQEIPAIGFGMGDVVVELMLRKNNMWKSNEPENSAYMISVNSTGFDECQNIARMLRENGFRTRVDLSGRSLTNQIRSASSSGYRFTLILGEIELKNREISIKDMKSGKQWNAPLNSPGFILESIRETLRRDNNRQN